MITVDFLKSHFFTNDISKQIKGIFSYGSTVYGNKTPDDFDFIVITENYDGSFYKTIDNIEIQATFYSFDKFKSELERHEIAMIECMCIPMDNDVFIVEYDNDIKKMFNDFILDKSKLRTAISKKSSNSYVKAKKKIILEKDFDIASSHKSLWHSFRMVKFAMEYCQTQTIDFSAANDLYSVIHEDYDKLGLFHSTQDIDYTNAWNALHAKYKPIHNTILSEFRTFAPKD